MDFYKQIAHTSLQKITFLCLGQTTERIHCIVSTEFYNNTTTFECVVKCEEEEKNLELCVYNLKKFKAKKQSSDAFCKKRCSWKFLITLFYRTPLDDCLMAVKIADSAIYQHFQILVGTYERALPEKNNKAVQTAVGKVWKKMKPDFACS